jgi:hypothetical protein
VVLFLADGLNPSGEDEERLVATGGLNHSLFAIVGTMIVFTCSQPVAFALLTRLGCQLPVLLPSKELHESLKKISSALQQR